MKIKANELLLKYEILLKQKQQALSKAQAEIDICYQIIDDIKREISKEEDEIKKCKKVEVINN